MRIGLVVGMAAALLAARGATQQFVHPVYPVESAPHAIAVIDLDGDAPLDLATANYDDDSISLLRARPEGGYEPALSWPGGDGPIAMRVADMNLDGHGDVLVADELSSQLAVLWLTDEGQTVTTSSYAQAGQPLDLAAGDLDGDGDVDVVIAETEADRVAVRPGLGPAGLGPATIYAVGQRPVAVELTDLDGDGDLDLVTANHDTRDVSVLINDGSGAFSPNSSFNLGSLPTDLAVADYDGDGHVDVAVSLPSPLSVRLLLGDGSGGLQAGPILTLPESPQTLAVGELNGDGLPDLIATTTYPVGFCALSSAGGGAYAPAVQYLPLMSIQCATLADLDDDGRTDLVVERAAGVLLLRGNGQGGFSEPVKTTVQPLIGNATLADVDGDGSEDLLGQHLFGAVEARLADGTGGFGAPIVSTLSGGSSLATSDFDGDGLVDVVIGSYGDLHVGLGDGAGTFVPASTFPFPEIVMDSDGADMTGDGAADLIVLSWLGTFGNERHTLRILPGNGAGELGPAEMGFTYGVYSTDPGVNDDGLLLADFDGDADLDVAVADGTAGVIRLFVNDGAGGLTGSADWFVSGLEGDQNQQTLASGDLDGDGDLDLVARTKDGVSLMLGTGGGSFGAPTMIASNFMGGRRHIRAGDVDDDGDMDLVCNVLGSHFLLLRGDGLGAFEEERYGSGTYPYELELGRIDGDGLPDVVVVAAAGGNATHALSYLNLALSAQWADLGYGLAGTDGVPLLVGSGPLQAGSAGTLKLSNANTGALAALFISAQSVPTPFKGGVLATVPPLISFTLFTSPAGTINLSWTNWPGGVPGSTWYFQYGIADAGGPNGVALSNALRATQP